MTGRGKDLLISFETIDGISWGMQDLSINLSTSPRTRELPLVQELIWKSRKDDSGSWKLTMHTNMTLPCCRPCTVRVLNVVPSLTLWTW